MIQDDHNEVGVVESEEEEEESDLKAQVRALYIFVRRVSVV